ncbi:ribosome maturation factor RimP [Kocuria sp.]|uniref:ribosome maturation factor RimP n=1 Tax=Kocuria sp. TaxID=1871328 RepID=UPI00289AB151|nr:ribosome maturation factor RimP [Kocuria sp.]
MSSVDITAIRNSVEPVVTTEGLFLEELDLVQQAGQRTLRIVLDLPDGTDALNLDRLAEVSRAISAALDEHDPVPGPPYELEVSTPGATRELENPRHWKRNVGRLVRIRPAEGERYTARLLEAHDDHAVVQRWHQPKKGMPIKHLDPERVEYQHVRGARVEVEI